MMFQFYMSFISFGGVILASFFAYIAFEYATDIGGYVTKTFDIIAAMVLSVVSVLFFAGSAHLFVYTVLGW